MRFKSGLGDPFIQTVVWTVDLGTCNCFEMAQSDFPDLFKLMLSSLDFPIVVFVAESNGCIKQAQNVINQNLSKEEEPMLQMLFTQLSTGASAPLTLSPDPPVAPLNEESASIIKWQIFFSDFVLKRMEEIKCLIKFTTQFKILNWGICLFFPGCMCPPTKKPAPTWLRC